MELENKTKKVIPFLKWAGGKRWLTSKEIIYTPPSYKRYIEPFLGSGAIFFHLNPSKSLLNDINPDLIETYKAIRDDWHSVVDVLKIHHRKHSRDYYYKIRASKPQKKHTKAAKFIYLNRTCWNGLYRVNLKGEFNVPIGTKKDVLLNSDDFMELSRRLSASDLFCVDFQEVVDKARSEDFILADPPYTIKHNYNGFIKYNESLFSWDDQVRLSEALKAASSRGARFSLTNANHDSVKALYKNFDIQVLKRKSVISGSSSHRGDYEEVLIKNF